MIEGTVAKILYIDWDPEEKRLIITTDNENLRALFVGCDGKRNDHRRKEYIRYAMESLGEATILLNTGDFRYGAGMLVHDESLAANLVNTVFEKTKITPYGIFSNLEPWAQFDESTIKSYPNSPPTVYALGNHEVDCTKQGRTTNLKRRNKKDLRLVDNVQRFSQLNAMLNAEAESNRQHNRNPSLDPNYYITLSNGKKFPRHFLGAAYKSIYFKTAASRQHPKGEFYAYCRCSDSNLIASDNDQQIKWADKEDRHLEQLEKQRHTTLFKLLMAHHPLGVSTHKRVRSKLEPLQYGRPETEGSQPQAFARQFDPVLRKTSTESKKETSFQGLRPNDYTWAICAHNHTHFTGTTTTILDPELKKQRPKNIICVAGSGNTSAKKCDMVFPGLIAHQGKAHCIGALKLKKNGASQVDVYDFTHHAYEYEKNKHYVLGEPTKKQTRKGYKKVTPAVDKIITYQCDEQGRLLNPEVRLENSLTKSSRAFDDQIKFALSKGRLDWVNYFLAGHDDATKDFDPLTLNDSTLLKKPKKPGALNRWRSSIKAYFTSASKAAKHTKTKQQDNLLQRLWNAANNTGGKACASHMIEYQLALEALFKSYNALNDTTPNTQSRLFGKLSLIHAYLSTLNYYNNKKLPLDKAYETSHNKIDTQVIVKKPSSVSRISIVIDDLTSNDEDNNNHHHDYDDESNPNDDSDSSDDERGLIFNAPPQPLFILNSAKNRFKKKKKIEVTAEKITNVILGVLTRFNWMYQARQSMSEIAQGHLQKHPYIAFVFVLKQMLSILDPIAYLPLVKYLCKSKTFPTIFSVSFRENLSLLDGKIFDFKFEPAQKKLLTDEGITNEDEQAKRIKQADAHAKLFADLLKYNKICWIAMNHTLNRSLVLGSGAFKCTETLAMSSAINAYCAEAYLSPWVWQRALKNQRGHLKLTLNKHLTLLNKAETFQDLARLSLIEGSKKRGDPALSLKYIGVLNNLIDTLCQKIQALSDAIHVNRPSEKKLASVLDDLNMPRSVIAITHHQANNGTLVFCVDKNKSIANVNAFFNPNRMITTNNQYAQYDTDSFSDEDVELEARTPEELFKNSATTFFLQEMPPSTTYDKYVRGIASSSLALSANSTLDQPLLLTVAN